MSLLSRIFRTQPDPREELRPLWHSAVALSRSKHWYAEDGVEDSVAGRFDMISIIVALLLLRMERDEEIADRAAALTELFVEDMDGQLRESGVGDLVVGKHIGKLVSVLGGRLGALREAIAARDEAALQEALERNVTMLEGSTAASLAREVLRLFDHLCSRSNAQLLAGEIAE